MQVTCRQCAWDARSAFTNPPSRNTLRLPCTEPSAHLSLTAPTTADPRGPRRWALPLVLVLGRPLGKIVNIRFGTGMPVSPRFAGAASSAPWVVLFQALPAGLRTY